MKKKYRYLIGNQHAAGNPPNQTSFKKGNIPWSKGLRGIHFSPATEFKPGHVSENFCQRLGIIKIRYAKRENRQRKFIKIRHPNVWEEYAKYQWKFFFGHILPGDIIHHINGNVLDDHIENLIALPRSEHPKIHGRWGLKFLTPGQLSFFKNRYSGPPMLVDTKERITRSP